MVTDAPLGVFYASQTGLRSALRHCTATTFCASPSLILLIRKDPLRTSLLMLVLVHLFVCSWISFRDLSPFLALTAFGSVVQDGICGLRVNRCFSLGLGFVFLFQLFGHDVPSEVVTGLFAGCGSYATVQARASLWPVPVVVLGKKISSSVAAPSLFFLDLFPGLFWGFVDMGCVPV